MVLTLLTTRQERENTVFPLADYIVSLRHKFVCCAIPKNGCTFLKNWFLSVEEPEVVGSVDPHVRCRDNHGLHLHPPDSVEAILRDFYLFTFVRDPLKRIASAFAEKFVGPQPYEIFEPAREVIEENERLHGAIAPRDTTHTIRFPDREYDVSACSAVAYSRGLTFREFVRYLCASPDEHLDAHWRPQSAFLSGRKFSFVGRIDDMSGALPWLAAMLGVPAPDSREHLPFTDTPGKGMFHGDMLSGELHRRGYAYYPTAATLYDDEIRQAVLTRYAEDARLYRDARFTV